MTVPVPFIFVLLFNDCYDKTRDHGYETGHFTYDVLVNDETNYKLNFKLDSKI